MIVIVLIFGLILRLISINQSFWIDEATSALTTKMNLADFFGKFMPGDFHPPLYYLTLRMWGGIFGTSEFALRSLSVFFGIGTIYLVYLIGKKLAGKKVGIIASLVLATSGLHIYYSQEARMYGMSTFLVTLSIFLFTRLIQGHGENSKTFHKGRVGDWVGFAIILGLIGLTDYLPLLIIPVFWIYGFFTKQKVDWWKKFVTSHIILLVLALVWGPTFIKQLTSGINVTSTSPSWVAVLGTFSIKDILLIPVKFMIGRVGFDNKYIYTFIVAIVLAVFGFLIYKSKIYIKEQKLVYLWLLVPLGLAFIISIKLPVLNYFRFLFILPAFYLLIAFGVKTLNKKWQLVFLILVIAINLVTSFIYLTNIKFQREDWRSAVSYIEHNKSSNSVVIFPADSQMEAYRYYDPKALIYGPSGIRTCYSEIWLIRYAQPISDPNDITRFRVESLNYTKSSEYDFNGVTVWKYNSK